jgi:hypothetical protein
VEFEPFPRALIPPDRLADHTTSTTPLTAPQTHVVQVPLFPRAVLQVHTHTSRNTGRMAVGLGETITVINKSGKVVSSVSGRAMR